MISSLCAGLFHLVAWLQWKQLVVFYIFTFRSFIAVIWFYEFYLIMFQRGKFAASLQVSKPEDKDQIPSCRGFFFSRFVAAVCCVLMYFREIKVTLCLFFFFLNSWWSRWNGRREVLRDGFWLLKILNRLNLCVFVSPWGWAVCRRVCVCVLTWVCLFVKVVCAVVRVRVCVCAAGSLRGGSALMCGCTDADSVLSRQSASCVNTHRHTEIHTHV